MKKTRNFQLGVLIIGSLFWDCSDIRVKWRQDRLCLDKKQYVKAPIRYGRRSSTRGKSYTMVFSKELVQSENQLGQAIVAPCQQPVRCPKDLIKEAKYLWSAESNAEYSSGISTCKEWGRIVLLENKNCPIPNEICKAWHKHVSNNVGYGKALEHADSEDSIVDSSGGFLDIPWPSTVGDSILEMDALLATVTSPTIDNSGNYPSPQEIANAWNTDKGKNYVDYFCKNKAHGIQTFQDCEIQKLLEELWMSKN